LTVVPPLTVVLCTYRPRREHLEATLAGLAAQTLPKEAWELWIVGTGDAPTREAVEAAGLEFQPNLRLLDEPPRGIARARQAALRAFVTSDRHLMVFVDDDNVLAPDYLARGLEIAAREPRLGCWGGQLNGRFAVPPPDWIGPFLKYIAVFPLERELRLRGHFAGTHDPIPPTAGMFLRRVLAEHHLNLLKAQPERLALGGTREEPLACEDMDLGLGVLDIHHEAARFPELHIDHLIPEDRLTESYMARLLQSIRAGTLVLGVLRHIGPPPRPWPILAWEYLRSLRLPARHRRLMQAELRGERQARRILASLPSAR
jgi:hypothetical protein